jgi:nicotinate-nucleotide--dimethylbenzimidazole phosphoribosyltransferase
VPECTTSATSPAGRPANPTLARAIWSTKLSPPGGRHCHAGHVSAESGHRALLLELGMAPLLDLEMRLGEASGAGVAILLLRAALVCHDGMATFAEAGVSKAND